MPIAQESRDQWEVEPFSGLIKDGYIWGRGSLDDKNQIHAILEAAEMKIKEGFQPERTILFVFGHDEEVGGPEGANTRPISSNSVTKKLLLFLMNLPL